MNLLPVPRTLELTAELVEQRPPSSRLDPSLPAQGYTLRIGPDAVELVGADEAGLFYGAATLTQLARLHGGRLPSGTVHDHPDLPVRGVMVDISRDKVPTADSLKALIDRLASFKVNQVQLYSEHTFAYGTTTSSTERPARSTPRKSRSWTPTAEHATSNSSRTRTAWAT